jgi:formylglycine-generating enzyme required for sulfatase activity
MLDRLPVRSIACAVVSALFVTTTQAVTVDLVTVGNPGNPGELSGWGPKHGPICICGAVDYCYRIGKFEITAGQYAEFLNAVAGTDPYELYDPSMDSDEYGCQITREGSDGGYVYNFRGRPSGSEADWVNRPVNYVSWGDAVRFTNWLHNGQPRGRLTGDPVLDADLTEDGSYWLHGAMSRQALLAVRRRPDATWVVPTEDEWYKAAFHKNDGPTGNYYDYATGSDTCPSNDYRPWAEDPGNNATYWNRPYDYTLGSPYWRTEVGTHTNSESPYGTFDQNGNVWEWTEAIQCDHDPHRSIRGGSCCRFDAYFLSASYSGQQYPDNNRYWLGFRVALVPEPSGAALGIVAALGLLCWRRKRR